MRRLGFASGVAAAKRGALAAATRTPGSGQLIRKQSVRARWRAGRLSVSRHLCSYLLP